jgi:tRNA pseudouridine55 synthase
MRRHPAGVRNLPGIPGDFMIPIAKSAGHTSRRVVDRLVRILHRRDLGHAGTLDPFASGLLLVLAGRATKLVPWIHEWDKEYEAVIRLGESTDTLDRTGEVTARSPVPAEVFARVPEVAAGLTGILEQTPPMVSAIRTGGIRLHELARRGVSVERQARPREVQAFTITAIDPPDVHARITCASGTYVRSLAESLGERLGLPSHLAELRRTRIGPWSVEDARPDADLEETAAAEIAAAAIPLAGILSDWPDWPVDEAGERAVLVGRIPAVPPAGFGPGSATSRYRVLGPAGDLLALIELRPAAEGGGRFLRALVSSGDTR